MGYLALMLKMDGTLTLILGAGRVARRKAKTILESGGSVLMVGPGVILLNELGEDLEADLVTLNEDPEPVTGEKISDLIDKAFSMVKCGKEVGQGRPILFHASSRTDQEALSDLDPDHWSMLDLVIPATNDHALNAQCASLAQSAGRLVDRSDRTVMEDTGKEGDKQHIWGKEVEFAAQFHDGPLCLAVHASGAPALSRLIKNGIRETWGEGLGQAATELSKLRMAMRLRDLPSAQRIEIQRRLAEEVAWNHRSVKDVISEMVEKEPALGWMTGLLDGSVDAERFE